MATAHTQPRQAAGLGCIEGSAQGRGTGAPGPGPTQERVGLGLLSAEMWGARLRLRRTPLRALSHVADLSAALLVREERKDTSPPGHCHLRLLRGPHLDGTEAPGPSHQTWWRGKDCQARRCTSCSGRELQDPGFPGAVTLELLRPATHPERAPQSSFRPRGSAAGHAAVPMPQTLAAVTGLGPSLCSKIRT